MPNPYFTKIPYSTFNSPFLSKLIYFFICALPLNVKKDEKAHYQAILVEGKAVLRQVVPSVYDEYAIANTERSLHEWQNRI